MAGRQSAAHEAARKEYEKALAAGKEIPSARQLAAKHDLAESTLQRADWYHGTGDAAERAKAAAKKEAKKAEKARAK